MAIPGGSTRTINDLVPDVIEALQQRTDVAPIVAKYVRKALIELTESTPFEELRRTGPQVQLTVGQAIYPVSQFIGPGQDYSSPEVMTIFVDVPNNTVTDVVQYKTPAAIERMISPATIGLPAWFTRYGPNFHFGPTPNAAYTVYLRYQIKHPFPETLDQVSLQGQKLHIPDSWEEIVIYSAAYRIALVKRWNDQAKVLHDILFGDPEYVASDGKRGRPGLVAARLLQNERDSKFNSRQLGIVVNRYSAR